MRPAQAGLRSGMERSQARFVIYASDVRSRLYLRRNTPSADAVVNRAAFAALVSYDPCKGVEPRLMDSQASRPAQDLGTSATCRPLPLCPRLSPEVLSVRTIADLADASTNPRGCWQTDAPSGSSPVPPDDALCRRARRRKPQGPRVEVVYAASFWLRRNRHASVHSPARSLAATPVTTSIHAALAARRRCPNG